LPWRLAVHVHPAPWVKEGGVERGGDSAGSSVEEGGVLFLPQDRGQAAHEVEGAAVEGIDHRVVLHQLVPVALARAALGEGARGPVDDVAQLAEMQVEGPGQVGGGVGRGDEAVVAGQGQERLGLEIVVVSRQGAGIARVFVVGPGDEHGVEMPLRGPGGLKEQVLVGVAGQRELAVDAVVAQLVDVGIALVWNALAVAIDVHAAEAGGQNAIPAQLPDLLEGVVTAGKGRGPLIEGVMGGELAQVLRAKLPGEADELDVAEGGDLADVAGHEDGRRSRVALVHGDAQHVGVATGLESEMHPAVADATGRVPVDGARRGEAFAQVDLQARLVGALQGQLEGAEGGAAKVDEPVAMAGPGHLDGGHWSALERIAVGDVPVSQVAGAEALRRRPRAHMAAIVPGAHLPETAGAR